MKHLQLGAAICLLLISLVVVSFALASSESRGYAIPAAVFLLLALVLLTLRQRSRIHDTKRALRRSRIRSRAIVEASPDGIVLLRGTRITHANPAFRRLFGIAPDDLVAGRELLELVSEADREPFATWISQRAAGAVEPEQLEFNGLRRSGTETALEASCALVPFRDGQQLALFLREIGPRRALEARARQLARVEALADAAGEFVEEFETVYRRIRSLAREGDEDMPSLLEKIDRAATRGISLARRARALTPAPLDASRFAPLDFSHLISELCAHALASLPESITLKATIDTNKRIVIRGDPGQLRQAVWQLLVNAAQAQEEGELALRLRTLRLDSAGASRRPGSDNTHYAMVEIRDTGPGMSATVRRRAFAPFFTTKGKRSSGLGLTHVYGVTRSHGGFVELDTAVGRGTIARLAFPLVDPAALGDAAADPETPGDPARRWRGRESLLVVDDDALTRSEASRVLESYGYLVELASTPREAIERLRKRPAIDLVLLDMVLPGRNGPEVLQTILRHWPGQRVLMMSPYPLPEQEELALSFGAVGVYLKPPDASRLPSAVRAGLDQPPPAAMLTGPV